MFHREIWAIQRVSICVCNKYMEVAGDDAYFNMEPVFCTAIFWVCYRIHHPSQVFHHWKHQFRCATRWKILCNRGMWELPQVVAEALKSSTTRWLYLGNNDIGDEGAEASCAWAVSAVVRVWEVLEWQILKVRICETCGIAPTSGCRDVVLIPGLSSHTAILSTWCWLLLGFPGAKSVWIRNRVGDVVGLLWLRYYITTLVMKLQQFNNICNLCGRTRLCSFGARWLDIWKVFQHIVFER